MKTLPADLEALMPEPAAWTLNEELERRETICDAHMWFVNPQNSSWAPLFTADQMREAILGATERAAKKVPANWLDSMLTGPDRVPGIDRADSRTIETLLHRIAAAIRSGGEAGS